MSVKCEEIKRRREMARLTMDEAAARARFTTKQQWNAIESGARPNPSAQSMMSVAIALGCRVEDLMELQVGKRGK